MVQQAGSIPKAPPLTRGAGSEGVAPFCEIDAIAKERTLDWLAFHDCFFKPTVVRLAKAKKDLGLGPALGKDMILPQHRPTIEELTLRPVQDEHPVCCFFYGTLADPDGLSTYLNLTEEPLLLPAPTRGDRIKICSDKYRALVDDVDGSAVVRGHTPHLMNQEQEDALRFYETDKYEVVRCLVGLDDQRKLTSLTFRFVGSDLELD